MILLFSCAFYIFIFFYFISKISAWSLEMWTFIPSSITYCTKLSGLLTPPAPQISQLWNRACPFTSKKHLGTQGGVINMFNTKPTAQNTQSWSWWSHCKLWGPSQFQLETVKKNLGWFSLGFLLTQGKKRRERREEGKKYETLQKAKPIAREHKILKSLVPYVYGSQGKERSKLQLHHLFFTITLITVVISQK